MSSSSSMSSKISYNFLIKILIIGDSGVGKTSFVHQFKNEIFPEYHDATIGIELAYKFIKINDDVIKIHFWDAGGLPTFHNIVKSYFYNTDIIFIMFDLTSYSSFEHAIDDWMNCINKNNSNPIKIVLIGNKLDKIKNNYDFKYDGKMLDDFAKKYSVEYYFISSKDTGKVNEIITKVIGNTMSIISSNESLLKNHSRNAISSENHNIICNAIDLTTDDDDKKKCLC